MHPTQLHSVWETDCLAAKSQLAGVMGVGMREWFTAEFGNRQADHNSPLSFTSLLERLRKQQNLAADAFNI